jgi:hypothetical protein
LGDLVFVDDGQHAVHHAACRGVVDVLLGRGDEPYTELFEGGHHDGVVDPVASEAGQCVDDHVTYVGVCLEVGDHLLELGALVDRLTAAARLDELLHVPGPEFAFSLFHRFALGWQRDAFGVVVGIDLSFG